MNRPTLPRPASADPAVRLQALTDFVGVVSGARGRVDVLRLVAIAAREALDASMVSLSVWDREASLLRTLVNEGELAPGEVASPVEEVYELATRSVASDIVLRGKGYSAVVDDLPQDDPVRELLISKGKYSCLGVPIIVDGAVWGELWAARTLDLPAFAPADVEFAGLVAGQASAGVIQAEHVARVERLAYTDDLTGLANRRAFEERLETAVTRFRGSGVSVAVVVLDVNGLKRINDRHGHLAGDAALASFGALLAAVSCAMEEVTAARLGGDEFALLCVGLRTERVVAIAEEVTRRGHEELDEGVACGLAVAGDMPGMVITPARLLRAADAAQYRAKQARLSVPVVAGRRVAVASRPEDSDLSPERRTFRDKPDQSGLLEVVVAAVDSVGVGAIPERLAALAAAATATLDAAGWWVSQSAKGTTLLQTRRHGRVMGRTELDEKGEIYDVGDYPSTALALAGSGVFVSIDDPQADATELALLTQNGMRELLMAGAVDRDGHRWLVEIFGDDISTTFQPHLVALRAAVALAVAN
jgi:diguanylate cyclase (GGDEF)-like protein